MKLRYIVFMIISLFAFTFAFNVEALTIEKVNVLGGINLRTGPGTNYKVNGTAKYMDSVNVLNTKTISGTGCSKGWLKVNYNGLIRYVCSNEITSKAVTVKVKSKSYLRNGKGYNYKAYKSVKKNTMLSLSNSKRYKKSSSCPGGWYKLVVDRSKKKYICSNYTKAYTDKNVLIVTNKSGTNLNSGAKNKKYATAKYGTSLTLYATSKYSGSGCKAGYYKVLYKGKKLYVCSINALITKANGIVTSPTGVAMRGKASTSGNKIVTLNYGDNLALVSATKYSKGSNCSSGWFKVHVNGKFGYVCSNYVSVSSMTFNTNKNTIVRSSNKSSAGKLGTLAKGKIGVLLSTSKYSGSGCSSGWLKITYNGKDGYVCSSDTDFKLSSPSTGNKSITKIKTSKGYYNTISNWTYRVNEDYAYIRTSTSGSVKDVVYLGTELDYLGSSKATSNCSSGWYKVKYFTNKTGYICKTYVDKYSDITKTNTSYCNTLKNKGFPASYCPYLSYIHSKHPKWVFKPEKTKVTFLAAVNGESRKNYTQNTKGAYLYSYSIAEAGGWRVANDAYIGFMIDPRNYLNEKNIFAFENLSYDSSVHTKSAVRSILSGTWLDNNTYAGYFVNAGKDKNNNVSPIHLAARVKQEGGSNKNYAGVSGKVSTTWNVVSSGYICSDDVNVSGNSISVKSGKNPEIKKSNASNSDTYKYTNGKKITANSKDTLSLKDTKKVSSKNGCKNGWYKVKVNKSLKGIYNFYNIGAYGSNPVVRGLAAAAGYVDDLSGTPWNTHEKAIKYGASFIAKGYISKGQDTLFYQKFNVGPNNYYNKYTHQYMTNILAPASESLSSYRSYTNLKIIDKAYSFKIPVYNSMPSNITSHPIVK